MARARVVRVGFNRGLISRLGLARADVQRLAFAAEVHTNWLPRVLGSMSIRPGLNFLSTTRSNLASRSIPFVFSTSDTARLELTNQRLRVFISDAVISRPAVSSAVANGNFDTDVASWTDNDEAGGTSAWVTGGYLGLTGNGTAAAIRDQAVTVASGDQGVEHALRIVIQRGPVILRVGSTTGDDDYIAETVLDAGQHSLAFTPTGNFNIRFLSRLKRQVLVDSCTIEASGTLELPTPWIAADLNFIAVSNDLQYSQQSGDIIFVACDGYQQYKIERRATRSWSVVRYQADDGPFRAPNVGPITLTPGALSGNTTLTASAALFKSTHAPSTNNDGALFRVVSNGQKVTASVTAANQFSSAIKVTGVGAQRQFTVIRSGTWVATVTLQRSLDSATGPWTDVATYTNNGTVVFDDTLNNQIAWYRIGVKTGDFTSGTVVLELNYGLGSIIGVCRVTGFTSSTVVNIEVIQDFGGTDASDDWSEGKWSDRRGWPTAGAFFEGRLWWTGKNGIFGSVSDGFFSFDDEVEGDSGPINRTIGSGPVDVINWVLPLQRLILGAEGAEHSARSSSLDEILTPSNFNIKPASAQGSSFVHAVKVDSQGLFVGKGGTRVFELEFGADGIDYRSTDVTAITPEVCEPEVVRMAVQRLPDTRVHFVLSDGTVAMLVYDKVEETLCWLKITSPGASGVIEDVCILPAATASTEDQVYYTVRRTVNSATVRYHEKWALDSQTRPDSAGALQVCRLADSFVTYNQTASPTISGLGHLEGQTVVVWDNGKCLRNTDDSIATFLVTGGQITVTNAGAAYSATVGMVGLTYTASWQSAKLVELLAHPEGTLTDEQRIEGLSLILADVHARGLRFGRNLTIADMDELPQTGEEGEPIDVDALRRAYVMDETTFPGGFSSDARLCLLAQAPRPCTVLGVLARLEHY